MLFIKPFRDFRRLPRRGVLAVGAARGAGGQAGHSPKNCLELPHCRRCGCFENLFSCWFSVGDQLEHPFPPAPPKNTWFGFGSLFVSAKRAGSAKLEAFCMLRGNSPVDANWLQSPQRTKEASCWRFWSKRAPAITCSHAGGLPGHTKLEVLAHLGRMIRAWGPRQQVLRFGLVWSLRSQRRRRAEALGHDMARRRMVTWRASREVVEEGKVWQKGKGAKPGITFRKFIAARAVRGLRPP